MKYPGDEIKVIKSWEIMLSRPGMYLGKKSIYGLQCLIEGIRMANYANPHAKDIFEVDWLEFEKWVWDKTKTDTIRSLNIALKLSDDDDEKAFDLWAEWFREFKAQKG